MVTKALHVSFVPFSTCSLFFSSFFLLFDLWELMRETERRVGKKKKRRIGKEGGGAMNRVSEPETGLSLFYAGKEEGE